MSLDTAADYALMLTGTGPQPSETAHDPVRPSARERELVTLVAQGRTDAPIAAQLCISIRTVRTHLDRIRDKTGCRRRADLTRLGRLAAVLAVLAGAVLASAAVIPAAWAGIVVPGPGGPYGPVGVTPAPQTGVQVITAGGMAGWQIALIAAAAAVVAAAAAMRLDRSLTRRRAGPVIAARRFRPARGSTRPARPHGADPAHRAASTRDASLPPAPASGTPDIVEFGSSLTR